MEYSTLRQEGARLSSADAVENFKATRRFYPSGDGGSVRHALSWKMPRI